MTTPSARWFALPLLTSADLAAAELAVETVCDAFDSQVLGDGELEAGDWLPHIVSTAGAYPFDSILVGPVGQAASWLSDACGLSLETVEDLDAETREGLERLRAAVDAELARK